MSPIATIRFQELETGEDCVAIVQSSSGKIALALSRKSDGDVEIVFTTAQTSELIQALTAALKKAEQNTI